MFCSYEHSCVIWNLEGGPCARENFVSLYSSFVADTCGYSAIGILEVTRLIDWSKISRHSVRSRVTQYISSVRGSFLLLQNVNSWLGHA